MHMVRFEVLIIPLFTGTSVGSAVLPVFLLVNGMASRNQIPHDSPHPFLKHLNTSQGGRLDGSASRGQELLASPDAY